MKSILLASVAIVGFAGIAVAEDHETTDGVSFSGSASFGYNDTDWDGDPVLDEDGNVVEENDEDEKVGFYWESDLELDLTRTLNNGLRAGVGFSIDLADDDVGDGQGGALSSSGFVLFLESDDAGIYFGDTSFAAQKYWSDADVDEMAADGFSEQDGETVLRGDVIDYGGVNASLSYVVADTEGERPAGDVDQLSLGASFEWGGYTFGVAYQEESELVDIDPADRTYDAYDDFETDGIFGIGLLANIAGFDGGIAYAQNMTDDESSLGILVNYPVGPVGIRAYYVMEDGTREVDTNGDGIDDGVVDQEDAWGLGLTYEDGPISVEAIYKETNGDVDSKLEGTYDFGNGFMMWAGLVSGGDDYYVAATQDLGGGAQLLVSYGYDNDESEEDEIGNPSIQEGATVEVTLAF
jgi:outer membrane protein OmpU